MARRFKIQERIFIVKTVAELNSRIETRRKIKIKFGHEVDVKTFDATVKKMNELDTVQDQFNNNAGREKISTHSRDSDKNQFARRFEQVDISKKACI